MISMNTGLFYLHRSNGITTSNTNNNGGTSSHPDGLGGNTRLTKKEDKRGLEDGTVNGDRDWLVITTDASTTGFILLYNIIHVISIVGLIRNILQLNTYLFNSPKYIV